MGTSYLFTILAFLWYAVYATQNRLRIQSQCLTVSLMNQDCKWSYNSGILISKSLSQVIIIATLWQHKLLSHNYLVYLFNICWWFKFYCEKSSIQNTTHQYIYKAKEKTNTCNIAILMREKALKGTRLTGLNIALGMQKHLFKCGIIVKKYSPHHAKGFIGASTSYSELTRGIGCNDQAFNVSL